MRTTVYIDGFNLYYRALKYTGNKWLNIEAMSRAVLPATANIQRINYYTAHVSGRVDHGAVSRQNAYLRALGTLPTVQIHYGKFLANEVWAGLIQPPDFRPVAPGPLGFTPIVAKVWKTEEKGSDVNIGVHLVRDAFTGAFEQAAVLTNDSDLTEALRIVTIDLRLPVILMTPVNTPSASLARVSTSVRHITPYLGPCLFTDPVIGAGGRQIRKPAGW